MFDIGWAELLLIGFIVLLAVGPNDIPKAMYQAGRFFRRLQYMRFALGRQFDDFMEKAEASQKPAETTGDAAPALGPKGEGADGAPGHETDAPAPEEPSFEPGDPANPAYVAHDEEMDEDMVVLADLPSPGEKKGEGA